MGWLFVFSIYFFIAGFAAQKWVIDNHWSCTREDIWAAFFLGWLFWPVYFLANFLRRIL